MHLVTGLNIGDDTTFHWINDRTEVVLRYIRRESTYCERFANDGALPLDGNACYGRLSSKGMDRAGKSRMWPSINFVDEDIKYIKALTELVKARPRCPTDQYPIMTAWEMYSVCYHTEMVSHGGECTNPSARVIRN